MSKITRNEIIMNILKSRTELVNALLDPKRDLDKECGYPKESDVTVYKQMYEREGISGRVVTIWTDDSWQEDPEVIEGEDAEDTEFEKAWKSLQQSKNIHYHLNLADEISGIGEFGILLLGIDDGKELNQPIDGLDAEGNPTGTPAERKLLYLRALDQSAVKVKTVESQVTNPRYGLPTSYEISFQEIGSDGKAVPSSSAQSLVAKEVHWHRVIHIAEKCKSSLIYGTPRMKPVLNRLYDLRKILGGSGEMFWKGGFPGIALEMMPEAKDMDFDVPSIRKEVGDYQNGLQRYLALIGVSAKSLSPQVADPTAHVDTHLKAIAVSLGVPYRIFIGTEEAQLAGSQDAKAWQNRIKRRRERYVTPMIIRPFVDRLIAIGVLKAPAQKDPNDEKKFQYIVQWPDPSSPTKQEQADLAVKRTQALAQYVQSGAETLMPPEMYLMHILGMDQEEVDAVLKAAEEFQKEMEDQNDQVTNPTSQPPQDGTGNPPGDMMNDGGTGQMPSDMMNGKKTSAATPQKGKAAPVGA